ncbi:hypothetical protein SAMN04487787_106156 [Kosakonia sacchari]|nr:hypothetical protein SAMN04487787_106156 [Kosakonia sacchari]
MSVYYFRDSTNNKVNNEENLKVLWINSDFLSFIIYLSFN